MRSKPAPALLLLASALVFLSGSTGAALAGPYRIIAEEPSTRISFAGDAYNLPIGPSVTSAQAIQAALQLQVTQAAMAQFDARGYLRRAASDTVLFAFADMPVTMVALAYNKPGLVAGPTHIGAPFILVTTGLLPTGEPTTTCTAGLLVADTLQKVMFSADSLPALAATDHSFDVVLEAGDGGAGEGLRRPVLRYYNLSDTPWTRFNKFVQCTGLLGLLCFVRAMLNINLNPFGLVLTTTNPEIAMASLIFCTAYAAMSCSFSQSLLN